MKVKPAIQEADDEAEESPVAFPSLLLRSPRPFSLPCSLRLAPPPSPRSLALLQSHQPSSFSFSSSSLSPPRILQHIKYSRPALLRPSSRVLLPDASFSALHLSSLRAGLSLPFLHNARTTVSTRHAKSPCLHDLL